MNKQNIRRKFKEEIKMKAITTKEYYRCNMLFQPVKNRYIEIQK